MCVHACKPVLDLRIRTQACLYSVLPFPSPQNAFWELDLGLAPDAGIWVLQDWSAPALFSCPHLHPPPPAPSASSPRPAGWILKLDKAFFFRVPHLCVYLWVMPCQFRRCLQKPRVLFSVVYARFMGTAKAVHSSRGSSPSFADAPYPLG